MVEFLVTKGDDANSKGIPSAIFIVRFSLSSSLQIFSMSGVQEDEEKFLDTTGKSAEDCLKAMQELYSKYKFMETQMLQQKKSLLQKIPDIENALAAVEFLVSKQARDSEKVELRCLKNDVGCGRGH